MTDRPLPDSITPEEVADILAIGHETAGVEFKPAGLRQGELEGRVIRAILGMANRTGGGVVVLGVQENPDKTLRPVGMSPEQIVSWNHDDTTATTSAHADPFVTFTTRTVRATNGMDFVILRVDEFEELPVLCKKEFAHPINPKKPILVRGACYVRTRGKPETIDIASQTEMRDLLTRAVDKGVARFVQRARAAGVPLVPGESAPTPDDLFAAQAIDISGYQDLELVDRTLAQIKGRGYWEVIIRPTTFDRERISNVADLEPLLERMQSRLKMAGISRIWITVAQRSRVITFKSRSSSIPSSSSSASTRAVSSCSMSGSGRTGGIGRGCSIRFRRIPSQERSSASARPSIVTRTSLSSRRT